MAYQQNFGEPVMHFGSNGDVAFKPKWDPISASEDVNGCFDCSICLDSAHDPVVTLCGHLYCWPCIYKWLDVQNSSAESDEQPKCPVCKTCISKSSLIPLYGRGKSTSESHTKKPQLDLVIPSRPRGLGVDTILTAATSSTSHPNQQFHSNSFQQQPYPFPQQQYFTGAFDNYASMPSTLRGTATTRFFSPTVGMFGEMVLARMFGSSYTSLFACPYNSHPLSGSGSPRMRRQEMQIDKSLNRVSIFLFCCLVLCLLLF